MRRPRLVLLLLGLAAAATWTLRTPASQGEAGRRGSEAAPARDTDMARAAPVVLPCPAGGYLCADRDGEPPGPRVRRWRSDTGTLVVYVPQPPDEPPALAHELQNAAAAGVRAWNGQPFPIRVEFASGADAHFAVTWSRSLGGRILGAARTRWSTDQGLTATSIDLVTRNPFDASRAVDPGRVRLTAAHEMGHALGLPHSDSNRDVMYPENTAAALSARDYRSMEALYDLPDGAVLETRPGR